MKHYIDITDDIKNKYIETNKDMISDEEIYLVTNKYKTLLNEIDEVYRCIRSIIIDDNLIEKTRIHIKNFVLWREFNDQLHYLLIYWKVVY